jgi:hypothetical protein
MQEVYCLDLSVLLYSELATRCGLIKRGAVEANADYE